MKLTTTRRGIAKRWEAPELSQAVTKFTSAVDVFAFSMLAFHILTSTRAFNFETNDLTVNRWISHGYVLVII
jgi:hypothetical protein